MFLSSLFAGNGDNFARSTPGGWISGLMGGRSSSGMRVTPKTAMSVAALQTCVTLLAESLAQMPVEIYERQGGGDRRVARDHPLWPILAMTPNERQTSFEFREFSQVAAGLRGNSFSLIDRTVSGEVRALYPMMPDEVSVLASPQSPEPFFRYRGTVLPMRQVHHVKWFSFDSYQGVSPLMLHKDTIGYGLALSDFSSKAFANGPGLAGVLTRPAETAPIKTQAGVDALLDGWREKFAGTDNAKKVALLQEGMKFDPLKVSLVDVELINALKLSAIDMCRIYKVPAHMANLLDAATYNNVENMQIQFVMYALLPWVRRHEQAMMRDLLTPQERDKFYIEFNVSGLLRGDQATRYRAYALARQWGWLSINDIRRLENLPPVKDGDSYLEPLNMRAAGAPKAAGQAENDDPDAKALAEITRSMQQ